MASTGPTATASGRSTIQSFCIWVLMLALPTTAGCEASKTTACDGLVYKASGLTRAEYLPCAGEMIATLDRLAPQVENMLNGDENARTAAQSSVRELRGLMKKAGWRDMLERWDDRALTSLNSDIWNAFNHHEACMMVAGQLFGRAPLGDEKMREPARSECGAYRSSYQDATRAYRRLR